jgi:hypothetical protein
MSVANAEVAGGVTFKNVTCVHVPAASGTAVPVDVLMSPPPDVNQLI